MVVRKKSKEDAKKKDDLEINEEKETKEDKKKKKKNQKINFSSIISTKLTEILSSIYIQVLFSY